MVRVRAFLFASIALQTFMICPMAPAADNGLPRDAMARAADSLGRDDLLTLGQARDYMLTLINRDRASILLKSVVLDDLATKAAQLHSDDMAENSYLSHFDRDGGNPIRRYTAIGGTGYVMENVHFDLTGDMNISEPPVDMQLTDAPAFTKRQLENMEAKFFNETPPHDGHRKNILGPHHTAVGIGLSVAARSGRGTRMTCVQDFLDDYGEFSAIPKTAVPGEQFILQGKLNEGLKLVNIDVLYEELPKPMTVEQLNHTSAWGPPNDRIVTFFPPPYKSPATVSVSEVGNNSEFAVTISTKNWAPGLYYLVVWITKNDPNDAFIASLRTLVLSRPQRD
jgi:hypothetical protein